MTSLSRDVFELAIRLSGKGEIKQIRIIVLSPRRNPVTFKHKGGGL
jgi:hypothetical protein